MSAADPNPTPTQLPAPLDEYQGRVARARRHMREQGMDGLVVTDPVTFFYFTGQKMPARFTGRPSAFVLPLDGEPVLISWSGPETFARVSNRGYPSWVADRRIYPEVPYADEPRTDWGLVDALTERGLGAGVVGIERGAETCLGIPHDDFALVRERLPRARFVESGPVVWGCRMIKSAWEIDCERRACEIGGNAFARVLGELHPGIAAREIQQRVITYFWEFGGDLDSAPPTVLGATGPGGTFQAGDVLYLDGGASFKGYKMDFTRRAVFGPPSVRQRDEHEGMWEILFKLMARIKPGVALAELFDYSQSLLAAHPEWRNYSDHPAKRIGHGIGLENEPPSMNAFDRRVLEVGMTITPEPKIESVDGLVNPEEQIVVTETGFEQLSIHPDWALHVVA
jgi:Xaa-Pro dipeptidase